MKTPRYTAPEIIADAFGCDWDEIRDARYQPTLFATVAVYTYGEDYYCCPRTGQKPPTKDRDGFEREFNWKPFWTHTRTGRVVYEGRGTE